MLNPAATISRLQERIQIAWRRRDDQRAAAVSLLC
jgi:hypothetical protein